MRLQVSVQRNALPPVRFVHNTSTRTANNVKASTIAELLDSISSLVPLESADGTWGLEDYVVEVRATSDQEFPYECLHFQLIEEVLQEDDEVVIRALRTEELRERRIGGRFQISGDGRHLLDGVSWGRRVPLGANGISRPQVDIPPRKRRRIELDAGAEEKDEHLLQLTFPDEDEEDDDFEDNEYDEDEDSEEAEDDEDSDASDKDSVEETAPNEQLQITATAEFDDLDSDDSSGDEETADEQLQDELQALVDDTSQPASQSPRRTKRKRSDSSASSSAAETPFHGFSSPTAAKKGVRRSAQNPSSDRPRINGGSNKAVGQLASTTYERKVDLFGPCPSSDEDSDMDDSIDHLEANNNARKADSPIPITDQNKLEITRKRGADSRGDDSDKESSEAEASASESSSDSTDSSDDSSDEESDDMLSSSATSVVPPAEKQKPSAQKATQQTGMVSKGGEVQQATSAPDEADIAKPPKPALVPPGEGMLKTQRNNARKRRKKVLQNLQEAGILDSNANFATLRAHLNSGMNSSEAEERQATDVHALQAPFHDSGNSIDAVPSEDDAQKLTAKKNELLRMLDSQESAEELTSQMPQQKMAAPASPMNGSATPQAGTDSSPQRAKLDLASSRRMLFNSLGVRTPKTPEEEQALRQKLSKPTRISQPKPAARELADKIFVAAEKPEQKEHWSEKLIISAVECHYVGREIDVPPFPFKHPWQVRRERLSQGLAQADQEQPVISFDEIVRNDESQEYEIQDMTLDTDIPAPPALQTQTHEEEQPSVLASTKLTAAESASERSPEEVTFQKLPDLKWSHLGDTAIIAFKELELGPTFEPIESEYKKARIDSLNEDGTFTVEMLTVQRSRPVQTDEITGERIFSKFDMPVSDDHDENDDRVRHLTFTDLRDPKLIKAAQVQKKASIEVQETETQEASEEAENNDESAIIPETMPVAANDIADDISIAVSTQTRNDINGLIKDAGFNSAVDEQLSRPLSRDMPTAQPTSPSSVRSRRSQRSDGVVRLRGGITTISEDSRVPDEREWNSSLPQPSPSPFFDIDINIASSDPSESMVETVRYPHLSQLELDTDLGDSNTQAKSSSFQDAQIVPPGLTVEDTTGFGSLNQEESSEKPLQGDSASLALDYLGSEVSQSQDVKVRSSPPPEQERTPARTNPSQASGSAEKSSSQGPGAGLDSDDESLDSFGLPSLRSLTSSQRIGTQSRHSSARIGQRSTRSRSQSKGETNGISQSVLSLPHVDDVDVKISYSQAPRLSQIPEDGAFIDLTQTSSPVKDEAKAARTESPRTRAAKRKAESLGDASGVRSFNRALNGLGTKKTGMSSSQV